MGCRVDLDGKLHCYLVVSDLTHRQSNMQACPDNTDVAIINNQEEFSFLRDLLANRMEITYNICRNHPCKCPGGRLPGKCAKVVGSFTRVGGAYCIFLHFWRGCA